MIQIARPKIPITPRGQFRLLQSSAPPRGTPHLLFFSWSCFSGLSRLNLGQFFINTTPRLLFEENCSLSTLLSPPCFCSLSGLLGFRIYNPTVYSLFHVFTWQQIEKHPTVENNGHISRILRAVSTGFTVAGYQTTVFVEYLHSYLDYQNFFTYTLTIQIKQNKPSSCRASLLIRQTSSQTEASMFLPASR